MDDATALAIEAFAELGIEARRTGGAQDQHPDLTIEAGGTDTPINIKALTLVTDDVATRLLNDAKSRPSVLLVVGGRVTDAARRLLTSNGAGYLDLRGRLAIRTDRLVIDAEIEPVKQRAARSAALSGRAGLEVATAVLLEPDRPRAVRELARDLGRSPSTVSDVLATLRRDGLLDTDNRLNDTDLFWAVVNSWPTARIPLASLPPRGMGPLTNPLKLFKGEHDVGWALTDTAAAAAYGAPVAFRSEQVLDFFVPDESIVRRATTLLGAASSAGAAPATIRVAPVPAAVRQRVDLDTSPVEFLLAHPLFVALDLAQDLGRGREILDAWTPDHPWRRVW